MLYTKSAEYAIQAMIYLAEKKSPDPVMVSEIAEAYNIPQHFLAKIAQVLVKGQLITAVRGRKGGLKLARPSDEIFVKEVVLAIEGKSFEEDYCVIGLDYCTDAQPCPFHREWQAIQEQINDMLDSEDLADLAERVLEKREITQSKVYTEHEDKKKSQGKK